MSDFGIKLEEDDVRLASRLQNWTLTSTRFLLAFINSATVVEKSGTIRSWFLKISLSR